MSEFRVDAYVAVRCDACEAVSAMVEHKSGWRWGIDGWLFYGAADVHLCPACRGRVESLQRARGTRPGPSGSEGS